MAGLIVLSFLTALIAARVYQVIMYDGVVSEASLIESANFAVQTITTVGYGNWETPYRPPETNPATEPSDPAAKAQFIAARRAAEDEAARTRLRMRKYSIAFMLAGSTFFTLLIGMVVAVLTISE